MERFFKAGFVLKEDIIKVQHNCKATGFWVKKSKEYNFLLIMHEHILFFTSHENFHLLKNRSSCRTEFLIKDGSFHPTEDAVVIGIAKGKDAKDALRNLKKKCPYLKNYKFDSLVARETGKAVYI